MNIFFETDKYEISIIEKNKIHKFLEKVDTLHLKSITVNAFCDDRGSVNYNEKLFTIYNNNQEVLILLWSIHNILASSM